MCLDYAALAAGGTTFWIEDLNGTVVAKSRGSRQGRTARSALMHGRQVRYAACALGPAANNMVPFFARACQRELDHIFRDVPVSDASNMNASSGPSVEEIAGLAHNLNNVLATITGNAELLEVAVADSARGREQVARISRSSRLARLFVARLGGVGASDQRRSVDLAAVMSQMIELTAPSSQATVQLVLESCSSAFTIDADPLSMEQLALSLLTDARTAIAEGGILEIRLSRREGRGSDEVVIGVRDISDSVDQENLTKRRGQELGLVRQIVAQHNGSIDVNSAPGRGIRVEIVLSVEAVACTGPPTSAVETGPITDRLNG